MGALVLACGSATNAIDAATSAEGEDAGKLLAGDGGSEGGGAADGGGAEAGGGTTWPLIRSYQPRAVTPEEAPFHESALGQEVPQGPACGDTPVPN